MKWPITLPIMLKLERALTSPYFIHNTEILEVFDQQHFIMITLHDGDVEKYLDDLLVKDPSAL